MMILDVFTRMKTALLHRAANSFSRAQVNCLWTWRYTY